MTNAIAEAKSIDQVVEIINASASGKAVKYFGGSDIRSAEEMAAQYAFECATEAGFGTGESEIEAYLDALVDAGATFDYSEARAKAAKKA